MNQRGGAKHKPIQIEHSCIEGLESLKIPNEEIELSGEVKYLGVILEHRLTWDRPNSGCEIHRA